MFSIFGNVILTQVKKPFLNSPAKSIRLKSLVETDDIYNFNIDSTRRPSFHSPKRRSDDLRLDEKGLSWVRS